MRQTSVREEESSCLTPEIVIIKTGSLSRSCTEDTDRCGDSVQGAVTDPNVNLKISPLLIIIHLIKIQAIDA